MRNTFIDALIAASDSRDDLYFLSGDAGLGVFDDFRVRRPERFLNMGVAEQNMASFAAGLAMSGFKVVLYNIVPFLFYRCYEQVRNDICYQRLPVVLAGIGSGVTYAPMGMTHYSVEDLGIARTLPNLVTISPTDPVEARLAAEFALSADVPVYVRLPKRGEPALHASEAFDIREPMVLRDGDEIAVVFHGSIGEEAVEAADRLAVRGIRPRLVSVPMVQPLSAAALFERLRGVAHVVSVEEHYAGCGLSSVVAGLCGERRPEWRLTTLALPDRFLHDVRDRRGMRSRFGIDADGIEATVLRLLGSGMERG